MKIKDYSLEVTIGLPDFSNIKPNITLTDIDSFEEAHAEASKYLNSIWQGTPNAKIDSPFSGVAGVSGKTKKIECLVGGSINYDEVNHIYTNDKGDVYLSGSQYAKQGEPEFNLGGIAGAMAKKSGADPEAIKEMWKLKGEVSAGFGTAIHAAIQLYEQYSDLAKEIGKETNHHDHPVLQIAVQRFIDAHKGEKVINEPMVVSHERKWAGQIDRLVITGDKKAIVGDIKTNTDLTPAKLKTYWKQLNFYATIMQDAGWTIDGLEIYHFDGNWKTIKEPVTIIKENK